MDAELPFAKNFSERIRMRDAEVRLERNFLPVNLADKLAAQLIKDVPWRAEEVIVWGKRFAQPRLIAWYGDECRTYSYSGIILEPLPWTQTILELKRKVETAAEFSFNSVLLNYYRDWRDSMGFHSDDENELGSRPVIASVSLGESRTLLFKHKFLKSEKIVRLVLPSGSLLIMRGETQQHWLHGIGKEARPCGPRVNLTFRQILPV